MNYRKVNLNKITDLTSKQARVANNWYNRRYNNELYLKAVEDKTTQYANALLDEALALSGHPYYKVSNRRWGENAMLFLKLFA